MSVGTDESIYVECHSEQARNQAVQQYTAKGYTLTNQQEAMVLVGDTINGELKHRIILTFTPDEVGNNLAGRASIFPPDNQRGG